MSSAAIGPQYQEKPSRRLARSADRRTSAILSLPDAKSTSSGCIKNVRLRLAALINDEPIRASNLDYAVAVVGTVLVGQPMPVSGSEVIRQL